MQQSDYILREIEKIGAMILGMIGKLRRKKEEESILNEDEFNSWVEELNESDSINLYELLNTDYEELRNLFNEHKGYNEVNIEHLADLLCEIAEHPIGLEKKELLEKALEIYQYLNLTMKTYSIERTSKISYIQEELQNHN